MRVYKHWPSRLIIDKTSVIRNIYYFVAYIYMTMLWVNGEFDNLWVHVFVCIVYEKLLIKAYNFVFLGENLKVVVCNHSYKILLNMKTCDCFFIYRIQLATRIYNLIKIRPFDQLPYDCYTNDMIATLVMTAMHRVATVTRGADQRNLC